MTDAKDEENSCLSITDDVKRADYYHGLVPRADIEPLLKKEGDFLLRKTETNGQTILALSVKWEAQVKHFMINQNERGHFYLETHTEKTVGELIDWHFRTKTPCSAASGVRLKRAVERPQWILTHDSIKMQKKLGEGAFGEVFTAAFSGDGATTLVAVKTMREEMSREARLKFMKEARLMRKLSHRNIVRILGVAVHEQPLMIVMELCPGGSLLNYLRKNKGKLTQATKLRFAFEASAGLAYLEQQNFIHRDIAARNCLLTEKHELKISDFGMSDERKELTDDKLDKVPVKWLAPETMQNKIYSNKTDVWSFGIMVIKVFKEINFIFLGLGDLCRRSRALSRIVEHSNTCKDHRSKLSNGNAEGLFSYLFSKLFGFFQDTPTSIAKIVNSCWAKDPADRPSFQKIHEYIKEKK
ncbi:Tyrosine-protein kinase [Aphelenchoides besseyi]|nr:Tyrosine-protein kinase [Aphelenchoides besseyi]